MRRTATARHPRTARRAPTELARTLWERLPLDAPDEVRLHDTRIDLLLGAEPSARPDAELMRRIGASRSPRRELDAAAVYWLHQHTAPRGLPAHLVPRPIAAQAPAQDPDDDDDTFERGPFV